MVMIKIMKIASDDNVDSSLFYDKYDDSLFGDDG
jgi:hypothetical protein